MTASDIKQVILDIIADIDDELNVTLSRADWDGTFPEGRTLAERQVKAGFMEKLSSRDSGNPLTAVAVPSDVRMSLLEILL